jgi:glutaconate CoA-transferase subunit A
VSPASTERVSALVTTEEAVSCVEDSARIGIGGAVTAGHPMALVRALIRKGVRDLTVISPTAGLDVDLLIAAGCVAKVVTSYVGAEDVAAVGPAFRAAAESGEIEVIEMDEAHCVLGLRAAAQGIPFYPWFGGLGTALPELNPELVEFEDPIKGRRMLAIPALELDVAMIHAESADEYGNVQVIGTGTVDPVVAAAGQKVLVEADRIVANDEIRKAPGRTWFWRDTAVVRAPWGTHPYSSAYLRADRAHLEEYVRAVVSRQKGDPEPLQSYLERYVTGPDSHEAYLESIGIRRILELMK